MKDRRVFSSLPKVLQTDVNKRLLGATDDILFEPEAFERIEGQIGDDTGVSQASKDRSPFIVNKNTQDDRYQLAPCVVSYNKDGSVANGAFYSDLVGHIKANGGITTDENRLFECDYFSFNPPINVDKWVNFSKYFWTGDGTADDTGEYIVKEPTASQTVLHFVEADGSLTKKTVILDSSDRLAAGASYEPAGTATGDLREDCTDTKRTIYRWDGSAWQVISIAPYASEDDIPADIAAGTYVYIARTGKNYQRPVLYHYSSKAGRWITKLPVISHTEPDNPVDGMVWEDSRSGASRQFLIYVNETWSPLTYSTIPYFDILDANNDIASMTGIGVPTGNDPVYRYAAVDFTANDDPWQKENWWVHFEDLSPIDKTKYNGQQSTRPLLEYWSSIETVDITDDIARYKVFGLNNQQPKYEIYMIDNGSIVKASTFVDTYEGNTIFEYKSSKTGNDDPILGYPLTYDATGEILFELTLESEKYTKSDATVNGYRFFKDTWTNQVHSVWTRSTTPLSYDQDSKGVPLNLSNNPNHDIITSVSRSNIINHYQNLLDENSTGIPLGSNSYRWTLRDPVNGGTIIDTEGSLLIPLALLQNDDYDVTEAIRTMAFEYNRFMKRFQNRLTRIWNEGQYSSPDGNLSGVTATQMVDKVLTANTLFASSESPFWNSDMGTFTNENTSETTPILIPPSVARTGAGPVYTPRKFTTNSNTYILCHDGSVMDAYGDDRDNVILDLENRFYAKVPAKRKLESVAESAFLDGHQFSLRNFVANKTIVTSEPDVDDVVSDYTALSPTEGDRVYSKAHGSYANYEDGAWKVRRAVAGQIFKDLDDSKIYIFNGFDIFELKGFDRSGTWDYQTSDYTTVIRREFERWYVDRQLDPITNDTYTAGDKWSWNYQSAGYEGNWSGLYRRIYGTDRPHVAPWEILGFTIEPAWWTTVYTADSTDSDGNKRYNSSNGMWADLKTGTLIAAANVTIPEKFLLNSSALIPVDASGELLDPITAGIVTEDQILSPDRNWTYGDYSPVEQQFHNSHLGPFAYALAGYLMKPGRFVEFLWSDYSFTIGMDANLFGGPIKVDDGTLRRPKIDDLKIHSEDTGYSNTGINSWIAESLNMSKISAKTFADTIRQSTVSLGWKTNGFIDKSATIIKTTSGVEIPFEDVQLTIHKGLPVETKFHSGIQILKLGSTYQVYGYDFTNPFFKINYGARPVIGGKTTLEEVYTSQEDVDTFTLTKFKLGGSNDTAKFSVLLDGFRVKDEYIVTLSSTSFQIIDPALKAGQQVSAQLTTSYTNPSTRARKFTINDTDYTYYDYGTNEIVEYPYGHIFANPQEVVAFIVDYGRYYSDNGWVYEDDDWVDVAKRFAVWSQDANSGQIFVDVASGNNLKLKTSFGHMTNVEKLVYGGYSLLDIAGMPITNFDTYRFDDDISIKSDELIFGLRSTIIDVQHAVFISNKTRFNDLVYDPFTGLRQKRLEIKSLRTKEWAGRLDTPGYIINGDKLIPNFEKHTKDFVRYYDMLDPVSDPKFRDQAFNLYGWYYRDYAREMNINEVMSLSFHKNSIREKGTPRAVKGFASAKENDVPIEILECWAWKEGDFGKTAYDNPVRFNIFDSDFRNRIQSIVFGTSSEPNVLTISDYDRDQSHARWVVPPKGNNFSFPMSGSNPSTEYDIRALVLEDEFVNKKMFHFDPKNGLHEPIAYSQIDIETAFDPAYYNKGNAASSEGYEWGPERIGTIWWNTTNREYQDYLNQSLSLKDASERWGELKNFKISSSQIHNSISIKSVVEAGHDLVLNQSITVQTKDGQFINGVVDGVDGNTITYTLLNGPESVSILSNPLTLANLDTITNRSIDVYEWIEARVPPSEFSGDEDDIIILNPTSPSYTEIIHTDGTKRYYYWVKNRRVIPEGKSMTPYQISNQLHDPTTALIPWFGVFNASTMFFNAAALETRNDLSIQIFTFPKEHEDHDQWAILVENDRRSYMNPDVIEKIIDSLQGTDKYGNTVPASYRTDLDKFGSLTGQVIFSDLDAARDVFISSTNLVLKKYDKGITSGFSTAFPSTKMYPTFATGYWSETAYDLLGYNPSQVVTSISDRDALIDLFENDTVRINTDPYESYQYVNSEWVKVQAEAGAASINNNIFSDLRNIIKKIKEYISIEDYNSIFFDAIYEMMRQHKNCDWCYKTSYFDIINTINTGQPANKPFNETDVIIKSITDNKPYHSKARRTISSHIIYDGDNAYDETTLTITDQNYSKVSLFGDRLSFNTFDDNGFDTESFDVFEFDYQTWDRPELGTKNTETISTFTNADGATRLFYVGKTFPYLEHQVVATNTINGQTVLTPSYQLRFDNEELTVVFDTAPPTDVQFKVLRDYGYASPGLLSLASIDDDFNQIDSTYQHAVAVAGVEWSDIAGVNAVDDLDGGNADERIRSDIKDISIIDVKTHHTGLYGTFDAMPLDAGPFDSDIMPTFVSTFSENLNDNYSSITLTETINPVQEITLSSDAGIGSVFMFSDSRYTVGRVDINEGGGFYTATSSDYEIFEGNGIKIKKQLDSGDVIRLFADSVRLKFNRFKLSNVDFTDYYVEDNVFVIEDISYGWTDGFDIEYYEDAVYEQIGDKELLGTKPDTVNDIQSDHTTLDTVNLISGYKVINTTDDNIYTWTGSAWVSSSAVSDTEYFVNSDLNIYLFNGTTWASVYSIGDGTRDLTYKYTGISSGSIVGGSDYGLLFNSGSWDIQNISSPSNTSDIKVYWNFNSIKGLGYDGDIFYWADTSGNGNNLIQLDDTKTPSYTINVDERLNSVDFTTGEEFVLPSDASTTDIFATDGYMKFVMSITTTSSFTMFDKSNEWSVSIQAGVAGDYKIIFNHVFSTTDGTWEVDDAELTDGAYVTCEINYAGDNVANDPVIKINGVSKTVTETSTPVGTAGSSASTLTVNDTGSFKLVSVLLMDADVV